MYHPKRNARSHIIRSGCTPPTKFCCETVEKMFALCSINICLCLLLQLVTGKSFDLQYGYQEIEDPFSISQTSIEEAKTLEFDQISNKAIEEICNKFKVIIHVKDPERYINCLESKDDRSIIVNLVKREANPEEGSGDMEEAAPPTPEAVKKSEEQVSVTSISENPSEPNKNLNTTNQPKSEETTQESFPSSVIPIDNPGSFQGGFDKLLKNAQQKNNTIEDMKGSPVILNSAVPDDQINGEEAKTGESQEKPTAASPTSMFLIVIGALGVVGALAFVYNFIRSRKESREIDDAVMLEIEGKELKEMKPLMKSPLVQNGSKSMEYIDADPQIQVQTETTVEVN